LNKFNVIHDLEKADNYQIVTRVGFLH